jgi:SAM-dependent methyltransferase
VTVLGPADLREFVAAVDALGGPGDPRVDDYWRDISYAPEIAVDTGLDPFGNEYLASQIALYREISGRELDQAVNEHTVFERRAHVAARNPYNHGEPAVLARQLIQLASALRLAKPRRGARLVDMGCGWGLSSELASYLGLDVEAVDINPDFVALVSERAERYRYDIKAVHDTFDTYATAEPVDLFLFYECLHHAVEPWRLLARLATMLAPGGKIVACGEPINTAWWPHWGLRLDPLSLYCIHKHGWFENGWSQAFLSRCLDRALLNVRITTDPDPLIGQFVVASRDDILDAPWLHRNAAIEGAELDGDYIVLGGTAAFRFSTALGPGQSTVAVWNHRPGPVRTRFQQDGGAIVDLTLAPGETAVPIHAVGVGTTLRFESETWRPAEEIGNLDTRQLAFQISGVRPDRP